jgi:hypothetical protein
MLLVEPESLFAVAPEVQERVESHAIPFSRARSRAAYGQMIDASAAASAESAGEYSQLLIRPV